MSIMCKHPIMEQIKTLTIGMFLFKFAFIIATAEESRVNVGQQIRINVLKPPEKPFSDITDFGELSLEQINSYPTHLWTSGKEEILKTLNSEQAMVVLNQIKAAGKMSTWAKLLDVLKNKLERKQIIFLINSTDNSKESYAKQISQSLSQQLGDPKSWTVSLLNELGSSSLNLLPSDLLKIQSVDAKSKLLSLLELPSENNDHEILVFKLVEIVYGPIKSWRTINESMVKWLPRLSPMQINDIHVHTVMNHLQYISILDFGDRAHTQPMLQKVLSTLPSTASLTEAQKLFLSMGKLITFLRLQDVEQLPIYWFSDITIQNVVSQSGNDDKALGRYILMLSGPKNGQWTQESVIQLLPFLPYASHQLLTHLVNEHLLDRQCLTWILNRTDLDLGQIQALQEMGQKTYKHEGQWDLTSMPISLMYVLTSEDIEKMRPEDVVNNMNKFNAVAYRLDTLQKTAITNKLCELGLSRVAKVEVMLSSEFIKMIPDQKMLILEDKDNEKLIQSMPINSPQVRRYLEKKYTNKNITLEDIRTDRILAMALSCNLLKNFPDSNIMELLTALRTATVEPLKYKTTRCLADKLKTHLKSEFEGDSDDEQYILSMIKETELGIVGGDVLIHFSAEALQEQVPTSKCQQIFYLIGHQPLTTINLLQPQEKKRQLARAAINCLDKQEDILDLNDMITIGNLMGYLPEIAVDKMNEEAFKFNLPLLSSSEMNYDFTTSKMFHKRPETFAKTSVAPCLSVAMRQAIRRKLIKVMRHPDSWDETRVRTVGCLLSTLYLEQLRSINNVRTIRNVLGDIMQKKQNLNAP